MNLSRLKATEGEIECLALRETNATLAHEFGPICLGPVFAVFALTMVLIFSLPMLLFKCVAHE